MIMIRMSEDGGNRASNTDLQVNLMMMIMTWYVLSTSISLQHLISCNQTINWFQIKGKIFSWRENIRQNIQSHPNISCHISNLFQKFDKSLKSWWWLRWEKLVLHWNERKSREYKTRLIWLWWKYWQMDYLWGGDSFHQYHDKLWLWWFDVDGMCK